MDEQMALRDTKKDPATIEREIDQTRAEMNKTLDALEHRLTAGQLLDQCLNFFGTTGREAGASLGRSLQENPIPLILTATGIAWMMTAPRQGSTVASDNGERRYGAVAENLSHVSAQVKSSASSARDQLTRSKDAMKDAMTDSVDAVKERVSSTASIAQAQARRVRQQFNSTLEEQPLVLGAIGLAIGAAIGLMVPSTDQEDRFMGEARDNIVERGKEIGTKAYEKGRETVNQAVTREGTSGTNVPLHPET
jgi:ElaB/YqjD/DUF883 family membrane-anchored ribosome-binding protein